MKPVMRRIIFMTVAAVAAAVDPTQHAWRSRGERLHPRVAKTGRRHRVTAKIRLRSRAENGRERRRGYRVDGSPVAASVPAQPGVTIGGLTIPAPPTDAQITGGGRVDAVYILATPEEIGFIKPMIAMRNGTQSGATLYASSQRARHLRP